MMPGEGVKEPTSQRPPGDYCPTCGKKHIDTKKKYMGMSGDRLFAVGFVIFIIVVVSIGAIFVYYEINRVSQTQNHVNAMIVKGGYYSQPLTSYSTRTSYTITVSAANGSMIDVYLMTGDQFYQVYELNNTTQSFAALESHENVNQVQFTFVLDQTMNGYMTMFGAVTLVLDNRDLALTPNDAVPQGDVSVSLDITASYTPFVSD